MRVVPAVIGDNRHVEGEKRFVASFSQVMIFVLHIPLGAGVLNVRSLAVELSLRVRQQETPLPVRISAHLSAEASVEGERAIAG